MRVSIVIPAFNEEKLLPRCLGAVKEAAVAWQGLGWTHEIIVCDNNSTDRTPVLAREAGAHVVFEPVNQIARARNRGAAAATGDWLLFLDADSFPTLALLADFAEAVRSNRYLAGGATVELEGHRGQGVWLARLWNFISRVVRWAPGGFFFCETATFRAVGGFSEELFVSEELDLSRRLKRVARQRGKRLVILHRHPLATSPRKLELYSRREYWVFVRQWFRHPRTIARDRTACPIWYDGRR